MELVVSSSITTSLVSSLPFPSASSFHVAPVRCPVVTLPFQSHPTPLLPSLLTLFHLFVQIFVRVLPSILLSPTISVHLSFLSLLLSLIPLDDYLLTGLSLDLFYLRSYFRVFFLSLISSISYGTYFPPSPPAVTLSLRASALHNLALNLYFVFPRFCVCGVRPLTFFSLSPKGGCM